MLIIHSWHKITPSATGLSAQMRPPKLPPITWKEVPEENDMEVCTVHHVTFSFLRTACRGLPLSVCYKILRAGSHLEVATFEAQTFITPAFKKTSLVSHGFQIGSSNYGAQAEICIWYSHQYQALLNYSIF